MKLEQELAGIEMDMNVFGFENKADVDIDSFFQETEHKEKEPKKVQCPHCGEWFEV